MTIACLDLEGVLVPEIWIAFAEQTGLDELKITTRDEPDYGKLMNYRLNILKREKLGLNEIKKVIAEIEPFDGAKTFLDQLRLMGQAVIISDTFTQFAGPLMQKLGMPTIFCNTLIAEKDGTISGYNMRCPDSKLTTVRALQSMGFETVAVGDSFNDLKMIRAGKAGFLFRSTSAIISANPDVPHYEEFGDLLRAFENAMN